jgi:uncharacterized protein YidB (DUF937 family)
MGLLDSVLGALAGSRGGVGGGQDAGGSQAALLNAVIGMLANGQGSAQGQGAAGGLGDLMAKFTQSGMGDVMASWIGHGQNAPISADQLSSVLGSDTIANIASQLGLSHGETAGQLSQMLPQVVDQLTPHGQAPDAGFGGIGDILAQLSQR